MLKDFVSLYEYVKELLEYIGADNVSEEELDKLEDKAIVDVILDIEEKYGVREANQFKSVEEIKEHLKRGTDNYHSKQLTRIQSEHNYTGSHNTSLTNVTPYECNELSDEGYISPCEEVVESNPSSKIYDLRGIEKLKKENCICCK
ncbi:hypothetical protein [Wolbachia endosymbiont of Cardiocondyla obscurior]|uniref:hypothetical protein n=1 Tax=Wolbachia endosymbiont of Cardiocondyla obscurior TaxID=2687307 RepID=UPI00157B0D66|nr:hypothetical protein [Wolbachia endosymbiont of Cardiocondyla obscurior]